MRRLLAALILLSATWALAQDAPVVITPTAYLNSSARILLLDGSGASPSLGFTNDAGTDTGLYLIGANNVGFTAGGVLRWDYNTTRILSTLPLLFTDNTVDIGASGATRPRDLFLAGDATIGDQLLVMGIGPHAIGGTSVSTTQVRLTGTFAERRGLEFTSTLQPPAGSSSEMFRMAGAYQEAGNNTHSLFAGFYLEPLTVTPGVALVTNTAGVYIEGASTAVVTGANYALWSDAGENRFDGPISEGGAAGGATSSQRRLKKVTAIADNTATDVFTVTVPNANHAAAIKLRFVSSNGSTDAFESTRIAEGLVVLARTTGVATVATAAALDLTAIATVAAGATHTLAYNVSAMAGAVGAQQTFTIQVTIDDSGNLGSNQVVVLAEVVNAEATGVTIQ